jgi:AraC-like DNA-binding protein
VDNSAVVEDGGHVFGMPSGMAGEVVRRYEAHSFSGVAAGFHRGLPSRALTFRFSLGEPAEITSMPDPSQPPARFFAFVGGLHSSPALIAHAEQGGGVGLDISPLACRRLFGIPAGSLASVVVALDDLIGTSVTTELCERLHSVASWADRFRVLDEVLARVLSSHEQRRPPPEVVEAWRGVVASRGRTSVEPVAAHVGWSRRHLASRFQAEIGLSPKTAIRVVRFEWACELLTSSRAPSLADVAARVGFYDQSHLNREWSDLAGCSPTAWLTEQFHDPPRLDQDFPFVQYAERRAV